MFFFKLISRLPFGVLYLLSDLTFFIGFHVIRYRRRVVRTNLAKSFPQKSATELNKIERQFYRNMCDYVVETLKLMTISREELLRRVKYVNPEVAHAYTDKGQSIVFYASHQFNWEWLLAAGPDNLKVQVDFVYQKQQSTTFNQFVLFCRTRFGPYAIPREKVAREVASRRNMVRVIAIVADQFPGLGTDKRYWTNFLNQETAFFQAINQIAVMTQYPAFYSSVTRVRRGYYEVELIPIATPPYDKAHFHVADNYARALEKAINVRPDNWLWSHKRWKMPRPSGE